VKYSHQAILLVRKYFIFLLLLIFSGLSWAENKPLGILLSEYTYIDYQAFLAGRDILEVESFDGPRARREVVEMILFVKALHAGGYRTSYQPIFSESRYLRILKNLKRDKNRIAVNTFWLYDIKRSADDFYITDPVIPMGKYVVGLYTSVKNKKALSIRSREDLKDITVVSSKQWHVDWKAVNSMPFKAIYNAVEWFSMLRMVEANRADVMLFSFQASEDMGITRESIHIIPVPNVKVVLPGSRHWVVSKNMDNAEEIYSALQIGLAKMRKSGEVKKILNESGFIHPKVDSWELLNAEIIPLLTP